MPSRFAATRMIVRLSTVCFLLVALLASVPASAESQAQPTRNNVHATATAFGHIINATVKADGRLYTREWDPEDGAWGEFLRHGASDWVNVDVAIDNAGNAILVATKRNGSLWTRISPTVNVWYDFEQQGVANWSTTSAPSVAMTSDGDDATSSVALISAVKADGRLYVRQWTYAAFKWGSFERMGATGWANADVDINQGGANRKIWLVGTKTDGRLYTISKTLGAAWGGWTKHGADTWSAATPPSISATSANLVAWSAVKTDGRLYVRTFEGGSWGGYLRQGASSWASASVTTDGTGLLAVLGTKKSGAMYLRVGPVDNMGSFVQLGRANWSTEQPSLASSRNRLVLVAVKDSGTLYSRTWETQSGFGSWAAHGAPTWAR